MWQYNYTPDPDDELWHYGVKGMKWKKRLKSGLNQLANAPERARQRSMVNKAIANKRRVKTQTYDGSKVQKSYQTQLREKKMLAKQQAKTKLNRAKRTVKNAVGAENRAKAVVTAANTAERAAKKAKKTATKVRNRIATEIKVSKQKRKNKSMAKKYRGTTQSRRNK